jgi:hypothetical protein
MTVGADTDGPESNCSGRLFQHGSTIGGLGGLQHLPIQYFRDYCTPGIENRGEIRAGVAALWRWGVRAAREEEEEEYHVEKDE